jgi:hypothetical protein
VVEDNRSTPAQVEQMENDLLAGAVVPPPPAPQVQATLDALLKKMKTGVLGEGRCLEICIFVPRNIGQFVFLCQENVLLGHF